MDFIYNIIYINYDISLKVFYLLKFNFLYYKK